MQLGKLKRFIEKDGSSYIAGSTRYAIAANSLIMVKRNPDNADEWILWSLEGRKARTEDRQALIAFDGNDDR